MRIMMGDMEIKFGPTEEVLWPMSVLSGIIMCKIGYAKLSKSQKIEWNNRGFSTFHAIVVAVVSFYLIVLSDLFKHGSHDDLFIKRKSAVSDAIFGLTYAFETKQPVSHEISLGYFLSDLAMILWLYPALGGMEYLIHHGLSLYAFSLALLSGQAHFYILLVLFSEMTTPFMNLRWYLDHAGQKSSKFYLWNGIAMAVGWLVARVLLFIYFFFHMYLHFDQVKTMFTLGFYSILLVPSTLAALNAFWFWKILRGLKKAISRKGHIQ